MYLNETHGPRTSQPGTERMLRQVGFKCIRRDWQGHREELDPEDFWRVSMFALCFAFVVLRSHDEC
jgi:hypothetical protein